MTVSALWLLLIVTWVGVPCMIVVFPDQTHLLGFVHWLSLKIMYFDTVTRTEQHTYLPLLGNTRCYYTKTVFQLENSTF